MIGILATENSSLQTNKKIALFSTRDQHVSFGVIVEEDEVGACSRAAKTDDRLGTDDGSQLVRDACFGNGESGCHEKRGHYWM